MSLDPRHSHSSRPDASEWSDASSRATLQLIAESVAQMVGFEVAVISAVHEDVFMSVAIKGDDDVRNVLGEMLTPVDSVREDLAIAEDWGRFKFIGHEKSIDHDEYRWVPDIEQGPEPDAWHPLDMLLAPLHDNEGGLRGLLSIDLPVTGRRPDPAQVGLLERYAAQAERALLNAIEREALSQRLRLAEAARRVVQVAVSQPDIEAALNECRPALLDGFRADEVTIRTYSDEIVPARGTPLPGTTDGVRGIVRQLAHACWTQQRVGILTTEWYDDDLIDDHEHAALLEVALAQGFASSMIVPMGAGQRCLGHLILVRKDDETAWTADERTGALEVARDIGHAVLSSRNLAREQRLVSELRELDTYKTQLLSTVSHELKNPLGAVVGHLELVAGDPALSEDTQYSVGAMQRATGRISRVVSDLLTLAKLEDPEGRRPLSALDLRPAIQAAADSSRFAAEQNELAIHVVAPAGPLPVIGDAEELERLLSNLVSNAVKYSPSGGDVTITVTYGPLTTPDPRASSAGPVDREVEIAISDEGIGISSADQERLFTEFFRSSNPQALEQPGTGLGLAIAERIVRGHDGQMSVESALGEGSTFRVFLPVPAT